MISITLHLCMKSIMFLLMFLSIVPDSEYIWRRKWPLQYSCLENLMDGGAWWAAGHRVAKSRTQLSNFTFTFHFHALEKEMATHSSVLAWRIPGTGEPWWAAIYGVAHRHNWSNLAAAAEYITHKFNKLILEIFLDLQKIAEMVQRVHVYQYLWDLLLGWYTCHN